MSSDLQEMDNVVKKGAKAGEGMDTSLAGKVDDLGGPTPENYRPTDDSAKLKDPASVVGRAPVPAAKPSDASAKAEETEVEEPVVAESEAEVEEEVAEEQLPEINVEEDVAALFAGEELSEEFQEKAKTVFEAAVNARVAEAKKQIEEQSEAALVEELEGLKTALTERVDAYLEYVAQEWIEENALQIEHGLKTEMTESFLQGMKGLFEDHYVSIPEDKYDVVENMVNKLDDMEVKLNEQIERNIQLNRRLGEATADTIFGEVSEGLALTQKDKLASLVEGVEFEGEQSYREKLTTLRESYFPAEKKSETSETLSEGVDSGREVSNSMSRYLETLSRIK
tara:strand:- start:974 stop:1990 length:1017 start_codon:yes stop_codon:yes gene_type:complete